MEFACNRLLFNIIVVLGLLMQNSIGGIIPLNNDEMSTTETTMTTDLFTETTPFQSDTTETDAEQTTVQSELTTTYQTEDPSNEQTTSNDFENYKFFDSLIDLIFVMHDFYTLTDSTLSTGSKLFQEVIADASQALSGEDTVRSKIAELQQFVAEVNEYNPVRHFEFSKELDINILQNFIDILAKCNVTALDEPTEGDRFIDNSLRQHGLLPIERILDENFGNYESKYRYELENFMETLAHAEPQMAEDEQLKAWLGEMKYLAANIERFALYFHENSI